MEHAQIVWIESLNQTSKRHRPLIDRVIVMDYH
jgi:hypothetical protein